MTISPEAREAAEAEIQAFFSAYQAHAFSGQSCQCAIDSATKALTRDNAELRQALREMVRWYGVNPNFPPPLERQAMNAAYENAKALIRKEGDEPCPSTPSATDQTASASSADQNASKPKDGSSAPPTSEPEAGADYEAKVIAAFRAAFSEGFNYARKCRYTLNPSWNLSEAWLASDATRSLKGL